jgi:LysM repeat protein
VTAALVAGGSAAYSTYTVRPGDTLSGVAASHRVSVASLAAANGIGDVHRVFAGTKLRIPGPGTTAAPRAGASVPAATTYVVRSGDRLADIAARFRTTVAALAKANGIRNPSVVRIGAKLVVPAGLVGAGGSGRLPTKLATSPDRLALVPSFNRWARAYGVPADLLKAMAWMESGWQNHKVSSVGAVGIGQLMPDTVRFVSGTLLRTRLDPKRPDDNVRMSARFLRYLLDANGGKVDPALASYYQGLRSVREQGPKAVSKVYAATIQALRPLFR